MDRRGQVGPETDAKHQRLADDVAQISEQERLLCCRKRPQRNVVPESRVVEEAGQPHERPVPVDHVVRLDVALPAQMVGERLSGGKLVHVAEQPVEADVQAAALRSRGCRNPHRERTARAFRWSRLPSSYPPGCSGFLGGIRLSSVYRRFILRAARDGENRQTQAGKQRHAKQTHGCRLKPVHAGIPLESRLESELEELRLALDAIPVENPDGRMPHRREDCPRGAN